MIFSIPKASLQASSDLTKNASAWSARPFFVFASTGQRIRELLAMPRRSSARQRVSSETCSAKEGRFLLNSASPAPNWKSMSWCLNCKYELTPWTRTMACFADYQGRAQHLVFGLRSTRTHSLVLSISQFKSIHVPIIFCYGYFEEPS